jgi:hypothetical protein
VVFTMGFPARPLGLAVLVLALGAAAALVLDRTAPPPSADVARGSEEPFAVAGLHSREIPPGRGPQRWTTDRARFAFVHLPPAPARLEVRVHGHRGPVVVAADGVVLGRLEVGAAGGDYDLPAPARGAHFVELQVEAFTAGDGRRLGALLDRVTLRPERRGSPPLDLLLIWAVVALVAAAAAWAAGASRSLALGAALAVVASAALLAWPHGLVRSPYATTVAVAAGAAAAAAAAFARWRESRQPGSGPAAFAALLAAALVQGLAATWPGMVVSDAMLHANKLAQVAAGNWFPTSFTQHQPPFEFPYGVSFYALLAPLRRAGLDGVALVRVGAALAAVAASGALFVLASPLGAARAALAVVLLQLLPGTFEVFSFGNLSNVFGQALTVVALAWWMGRARGGWPVGAALIALSALAHLSCAIVLGVLLPVLAWQRRDRVRVTAAAVGLGVAAGYFAGFAPLVLRQLPRFLEGGRQGRDSAPAAPLAPLLAALHQWGLPALALALAGRPRPSRGGLERDLAGCWLAGGVLLLAGVVSPLEVRYLYALSAALAVAAASGAAGLWDRGTWGRVLAAALLAAQGALALHQWLEALLHRYR